MMWKGTLAMAAALALGACGASGDEASAADPAASDAAGGDAAGLAGADAAGGAAGAGAAADAGKTDATQAAMPASAAAPAGAGGASGLSAYVGKWAFDEVNGVTWNDNPTVKAGIGSSVTDAAARKAIETLEGPGAMIEMIDGKVSSWACQAHNCGDHQWMVMVDPASGATDVCYHNAEKLAGQSRWFLAGGKQETRPGNCTVE